MRPQGILTALLLPPLLLVLAILLAGLRVALARGRRRGAGWLAALAAAGLLLLATPFCAGWLTVALERQLSQALPPEGEGAPAAIVVLGGDMVRSEGARGEAGADVGPLTLERLRAGAALHRRTGLPLLVTGAALAPGAPPIAALMAESLERNFGVTARWVEPLARDTRENAAFSAMLLRAVGIDAAWVVSHAWHLPRAQAAFAREEMATWPAPVRLARRPEGLAADWLPRPDHLAQSWYALREMAGLLVYRLRDGAAP